MASNVVRVSLLADAKGFKKGIGEAEQATTGFEKTAGGMASAVKGFFATAAVGAVVAFGKASIDAFAKAEQAAGSVESVFGDSADQIIAKSEEAAESFGISAAEFNTQAALIGSQLKNVLGLSAEEAADKTDDLIGKASDLAATFGGTTADAVSAISGLLRGERDAIEKYGVSMNDAAIEAQALESGLADTTKEMTPQIKAAAALELLYEQSTDTTGQFAEEADTLAGSMQILTARVEDLKARVGEELAPVMVEGTTAANNMLDALDEDVNLGWSQRLSAAVQTLLGESAESVEAYIDQKEAANDLADGYDDAALSMETARGVMGDYNTRAVAAQRETDKLAGAQGRAKDATYDHIDAVRELRDEIRSQTDPMFAYQEAFSDLETAQRDVIQAEKDYGKGSPEHIDALNAARDAALDFKDAETELADQGGVTADELKTHLRSLRIYTEDQIDLMIGEFERINAFKFRAKTIAITHKMTGGGVQEFQSGGVVQGPPGAAVPIIAHAGETILPTRRHDTGHDSHGGMTAMITINAGMGADPYAISKAVVQALQRYERANGAIPIRTRAS